MNYIRRQLPVLLALSGFLLLVFGGIKVVSATGGSKILETLDPVFPVTRRFIFVASGTMEIVGGLIILCKSTPITQIVTVGVFGLAFAAYRSGLALLGDGQPCPCLGSAYQWLGISQDTANLLGTIAFSFILASGLFGAFCTWNMPDKDCDVTRNLPS